MMKPHHPQDNTGPATAPMTIAACSDLRRWRADLEQYRVVSRLRSICASINRTSAGRILREQEVSGMAGPLFKCAVESLNCEMELALLPTGPAVVFTRRDSGGPLSPPGASGATPRQPADQWIVVQLEIDPKSLTTSQMKMWFVYLLSGFSGAVRSDVFAAELQAA